MENKHCISEKYSANDDEYRNISIICLKIEFNQALGQASIWAFRCPKIDVNGVAMVNYEYFYLILPKNKIQSLILDTGFTILLKDSHETCVISIS